MTYVYCTCTSSCIVGQLDQIKAHLLQQLRVIACGDCRQLDRLSHHCAHMSNNSPLALIAISELIQSHLALLQRQLDSSSTPHITRLLQVQFHDHITQTLLSLQSYTSQQIAILNLTQPPQPLHPNPFTPQPHPPTHSPQPPNPPASTPIKFYAVRRGSTCNTIFTTWEECKLHVHQFSGAEFKSFRTYTDAQAYLVPHVTHATLPTDYLPT